MRLRPRLHARRARADLRRVRGLDRARSGEETLEKAGDLFRRAVDRADFENGRFARSLFEQAYARMALRASEDGDVEMNELTALEPEDLVWRKPGVDVRRRPIGFGPAGDDRDAAEENPPPPDAP